MRKWNRSVIGGLATAVLVMAWAASGWGQVFGKNKVTRTQFEWAYIETAHFDIYFCDGEEQLARIAATMIEDSYEHVSADIRHELSSRVPVILYRSHNDFEETNVILDLVGESTGGFTEVFKNRIVVPFEGSYKKLRHVLHHELVHAIQFDMLYGGILESLLTRQYMFRMPLWFAEGMAEYESVGWDTEGDMIMRDAVITGYLPPLQQLQGYLVYKGGQSFFRYIAQQYGSGRLAQIMAKLKKSKDVEKSYKAILGKGLEDLNKEWHKSLRRKYWPEIAARKEPDELAKRLTDHKEEGAYLNRDPAFSPYGDKIAFLSDRNDYKDIYLMSAIDGKILKRLVKGEKQGEYEEMHWLRGGITWSPDGEWIAFVAKSSGGDVLYLHQVHGRGVKKYAFDLNALFSPAWSPDGKRMALVGIKGDVSDLYVAHLDDGSLERLTHDRYDESDPAWSPDGTRIAFASDRISEPDPSATDLLTGSYDIYIIESQGSGGRGQGSGVRDQEDQNPQSAIRNPQSEVLRRIAASPWDDRSPTWSPDGKRIAFASNRNGIYNLYIADVETDSVAALTNVLTGCFDPEWSPDGGKIAFTSFREGGWDIFVLRNPLEKLLKTMPAPTAWASEADTVEAVYGELEEAAHEQSEVRTYRAKFSPDIVNAMIGYSTYAGFGGQAMVSVSDVMGNHRFFFNTDLYYSFEDSDFQLVYYYLRRRVNLGVSVFHSKDYYVTQNYDWFSDRIYGGGVLASLPISRFTRLDFNMLGMGIDRQSYGWAPEKKQTRLLLTGLSWIKDTILWGQTGPVNGFRSIASVDHSPDIPFNSLSFTTLSLDARRYFRVGRSYALVTRYAGGLSWGKDPQAFFLGGTKNWLSPNYGNTDVWDVENLYFAHSEAPLRGTDYYEVSGTKFALINAEFRFPLVRYLVMGWPLGITLGHISGVLFLDAGGAWTEDSKFRAFRTDESGLPSLVSLKAGYGFGARINLGIAILRFDMAWPMHESPKRTRYYYFSLGPEF